MSASEFETDLLRVVRDLETSRTDLLAVLDSTTVEDLDRGRRGGWSVRAILGHLIQGEIHYACSIAAMREHPWAAERPGRLNTPSDAAEVLAKTRLSLLSAVEGVDEKDFYRLQRLQTGESFGQDYSILSVLENVASHDSEHARQIQAILRPG